MVKAKKGSVKRGPIRRSKLSTKKEACKILGISFPKITDYVNRGYLRAYVIQLDSAKARPDLYFRAVDLKRFKDEQVDPIMVRYNPDREIEQEAPAPSPDVAGDTEAEESLEDVVDN